VTAVNKTPPPDPNLVDDEASFLAFVEALRRDREQGDDSADGYGWENDTIATFLEAASRWAEDSNFGRTVGLGDDVSPWKRMAVFLYCGKAYE
jgi:hypothetical protein